MNLKDKKHFFNWEYLLGVENYLESVYHNEVERDP